MSKQPPPCASLPETCSNAHSRAICVLTRLVSFGDVNAFFQSHVQPCTTSIVYLNAYGKPKVTTHVMAKTVDEDCHLFYTRPSGSYIYVYSDLLRQLVVWAKTPNTFSRQGFLGTHVTIGQKTNGSLDIHETVYHSFQEHPGPDQPLLISNKKTVVNYVAGPRGGLRCTSKGRPSSWAMVHALWNDIVCDIQFLAGGGAKSKARVREKVSMMPPQPLATSHWNARSSPDAFKDAWLQWKASPTTVAVFRLPYIPKRKLDRVADVVLGIVGQTPCMLVTDTCANASFLTVGYG